MGPPYLNEYTESHTYLYLQFVELKTTIEPRLEVGFMLVQIAACIPGLLVIGLGIMLIVTKDPTPLHCYHRSLVSTEDKPRLAYHTGVGLIICGIGALCAGLSTVVLSLTPYFVAATVILVIAGIAYCLWAIKRFNHKIISW